MEKKTQDAMKLGEIIHLILEYNMTNTSNTLLDIAIMDANEPSLRRYREAVKNAMAETEAKSKVVY